MKGTYTLLLILGLCLSLSGQCLVPRSYTANNITTSSIDIDLSASGSGPWVIEYGPFGFMIGSGTTLNSNQNQITISNLSPATQYRVFIRRQCANQNSPWSSFNFTTTCGTIIATPINYSFDGAAWQSPTSPLGTGSMATCWTFSPQATDTYWAVGPSHETHLNTGPLGDHTTGFGSFLHLNGRGITQDSISSLFSPAFDLQGLSNPQLSFWYHLYGAQIDSMEVLVKRASTIDWDTLHTFHGQQQLSQEEPWMAQTLSLASFKDSVIQLQFVGYGLGTAVQMAIDDLAIHDSVSCRRSTFFRSISSSDQAILLDWDAGTGNSFQIEYGKQGFSQGNGTIVNVSAPPYRFDSLDPNSTYIFYLRDLCSSSQSSNWTNPLRVKTDCASITAPVFEDFEGPAWPTGNLEACWNRFDDFDFKWQVGPPSLNYVQSGPGANNHTPGGSKFIVADRPNQKGNARSSITSPLIDLDTINNPELVFWTHMFGLHITAFDVEIDSGDGYQLLKRIIGPQQLSKAAPWSEQIFSLSGYSGKKVKVKFTAIAASNWSSLARIGIDDFSIGEAPPCRKPTNLQVSQLKFTSAQIDWQSGGAINWLLRLQSNGGAQTISPISANPYVLSNLQPGTEYTIWVKDSCGLGQSSDWSSPLTFKTFCLPDTAPYFQDFEGTSFQVQTSWFSTGTLDPCWERSHELGPVWQPSPATILPSNLLPTADATTGSGKYIGGRLFLGNGTNEPTSFSSPHIDLSGLVSPELSFWYFLGGWSFSSNQIQVEVSNGGPWTNVSTILGPTHLSTSAAWLEQIVDLSAYAGDTIRLRFISLGNNLYAATAGGIDDISIYDNPVCLPPSNLKANFVTSTYSSLSWISGGATNWQIRYKPQGEAFQYQTASTNDSFSLNGLLPATHYEIWVRDSCGSLNSSWHGPIYIFTDCLPTSVPYYESFDGANWQASAAALDPGFIDNCWRRNDTLQKVWLPNSGASSSPFSGPSASRNGSGNFMMTDILTSPPLSNTDSFELRSPVIANVGLSSPELNFWYHLYGSQIQKLLIYVEKFNESRVLVDSIIGQQQASKSANWQQHNTSLLAFNGDTLKIVFVALTGNVPGRINIALDDVEIIDAQCSLPTSLGANNITKSAANLNWSTISVRSNIQFGLAGFSLGSGTQISNVNPGHRLNGLQPFTTYEFYVQDSCRTNNSAWAGPFSFTTFCSKPIADFSDQSNGLSATFDGSPSLGSHLSYTWDFGDGITGNGLNPNHTYASAGSYVVQLVTTDTCGLSDSLSKNILICDAPQAQITYTRSGLTVHFDGRLSNSASAYFWDFGAAGTSTSDTPTVIFPSKGNFPISLVVSNACGDSDTLFMRLNICDKPTASFTANITTFVSPILIVSFDGTSSVFADSFIWDFGDGSQDSTSLKPVHLYANGNQAYNVRLITRADCGMADTAYYSLNPISLDELSAPKISVYPNPADDRIIVKSSTQDVIKADDLLWFDQSGRQFQLPSGSESSLELVFEVDHLAAGTYLLIWKGSDGQALRVIIN